MLDLDAYCGSETSKSLETEPLFAALPAIDSGLQTSFQLIILHFIVIIRGSRSQVPVLTVCLSASYNMGRAMMYQTSKRWSFMLNAKVLSDSPSRFSLL